MEWPQGSGCAGMGKALLVQLFLGYGAVAVLALLLVNGLLALHHGGSGHGVSARITAGMPVRWLVSRAGGWRRLTRRPAPLIRIRRRSWAVCAVRVGGREEVQMGWFYMARRAERRLKVGANLQAAERAASGAWRCDATARVRL